MTKVQALFLVAVTMSIALSGAGTLDAQTADPVKAGRALVQSSAGSVVNIGTIVRIDAGMMGGERDEEVKTTGLVVDASGLTVVSRSAINPQGYEPIEFEPQPGMEVRIESEITSVWIQLPDGKRVDAQIVLTDPDLDLSFIRPTDADEAKKLSLKAADLGKGKREPELLEQVVSLGRLGKDVGWAPQLRLVNISAVLETPWRCFAVNSAPGESIFSRAGEFLGFVVLVPRSEPVDGMEMMMGGPSGGGNPTVVLPAAQIRRLIDQARKSEPVKTEKKPKTAAKEPASSPDQDMASFQPSIKVGAKAPTFALTDDLGKKHSLEDYSGKYVLLDWWGIW